MPRSRLYNVTITETAVYTTVVSAASKRAAEKYAEKQFLASIKVATMFCTEVPEREVSATLREAPMPLGLPSR